MDPASAGGSSPAIAEAGVVEIKVRDDGPLKVSGRVRLVDGEGNEFDLPDGKAIALCRCGQSEDKPFCDRAHRECGFESRARVA